MVVGNEMIKRLGGVASICLPSFTCL